MKEASLKKKLSLFLNVVRQRMLLDKGPVKWKAYYYHSETITAMVLSIEKSAT
jgi:hypothetical protein